MHRLLQQRHALKATIHNQKFIDLPKMGHGIEAVRDIEDNDFWKHIYVLLCALFSSLKALRLCDTNYPCMDKIHYLVHCACATVAKSIAVFNDETLFGPIAQDSIEVMAFEADKVFGRNDIGIGMIEL